MSSLLRRSYIRKARGGAREGLCALTPLDAVRDALDVGSQQPIQVTIGVGLRAACNG